VIENILSGVVIVGVVFVWALASEVIENWRGRR
jgi:hypothetical protein